MVDWLNDYEFKSWPVSCLWVKVHYFTMLITHITSSQELPISLYFKTNYCQKFQSQLYQLVKLSHSYYGKYTFIKLTWILQSRNKKNKISIARITCPYFNTLFNRLVNCMNWTILVKYKKLLFLWVFSKD